MYMGENTFATSGSLLAANLVILLSGQVNGVLAVEIGFFAIPIEVGCTFAETLRVVRFDVVRSADLFRFDENYCRRRGRHLTCWVAHSGKRRFVWKPFVLGSALLSNSN